MNIETDRLQLRPININDKQAMWSYRSDAEANKYQGWIPKTLADVEEFIGKLAPTFNQSQTWFQLAVIEKETGLLIGDIGIHFMGNENLQVELGYTIAKEKQGFGFATEALKSVIYFLFQTLKKHRITASADPRNIPSIKVLEKLGFRKEAHFIESYYQDGKWLDDALYALLAKELDTD